jgi:hypothetical protein
VIRDVFSNVSLFAHPWKHCCGNKIGFPGSKNVSYQIQKHLMFPKCDFCCGNIVSLFAHTFPARKHFFQIRACAKTNNTKKMAESPEVTAVVADEQSNKNS